jgi:uracil-DNA glycosylase family 4
MLDKMLAAISLDRTSCYISNIIPWRPPGNRTPVAHEIELCRPFVERHIELAQPKLLIFMGNVSTKTLLNTNKGILSIRGKWDEYKIGEEAVPAMPTLHPAYLLKNPVAKRNAWHDLLAIQAKLKELD